MKFKHYCSFATKMNEKTHSSQNVDLDWDSLRLMGERAFALENSKEEYIISAKQTSIYNEYAQEILTILGRETKSLCSLGVGKGVLEWWIKVLSPELELCCTDYTIQSLEKLKGYFPECNKIQVFDMLQGDYSVWAKYDAILMFRVSTEFDVDEWESIFNKISLAGIKKVIFVPTELMTFKDIARELCLRIRSEWRGEKSVFCGWMYSETEFEMMFDKFFKVDTVKYIHNTAIFVLSSLN